MRTTEVTENLKCKLTQAERLELSGQLARLIRDKSRVEENKKQIAKDMAAEIEQKDGEIRRLSDLVDQQFEYREVECEVRFNEPEPKSKRIIRLDTGEEVRVTLMTLAELQEELALDNPNPPAEDPQAGLPLAEAVVGSVVEQINSGALDKDGVTVTAAAGA